MNFETILLIIMVAFVIIYAICYSLFDVFSQKKTERKTKIYEAQTERNLMYQINLDKKENKWNVYNITLLKQTDDYIKVIVIFEVR